MKDIVNYVYGPDDDRFRDEKRYSYPDFRFEVECDSPEILAKFPEAFRIELEVEVKKSSGDWKILNIFFSTSDHPHGKPFDQDLFFKELDSFETKQCIGLIERSVAKELLQR